MYFSTPNRPVQDRVYSILAHFGGSDKAVAAKLWVTPQTVAKWRREKRVPPHVLIRYERETNQTMEVQDVR